MAELTAHEVQLNNARINFKDCVRMIDELLAHKHPPADRQADVSEIIGKANWAIDYLFRAQEEQK